MSSQILDLLYASNHSVFQTQLVLLARFSLSWTCHLRSYYYERSEKTKTSCSLISTFPRIAWPGTETYQFSDGHKSLHCICEFIMAFLIKLPVIQSQRLCVLPKKLGSAPWTIFPLSLWRWWTVHKYRTTSLVAI